MAGLFGILSIANQSIQAQQSGLDVTANNLANVNSPGYTRQVALLAEQAPFSTSDGGGGGVTLDQIYSVRDSVLEIRLNQETANQNRLTSMQQQLGPVQTMFSAQSGAGLGTALDSFFNSLQQLSTDPTNGAQRQGVITAAQTLAQTFQQVSQGISQQSAGADQEVVQAVAQVNTLTSQIATLNGQISETINAGQNSSEMVDQRTNLIRDLSKLVDFNVSGGDDGQVTLTTSQGAALVVGRDGSQLTTAVNAAGVHDVFDAGVDITSTIGGGSLAGMIQVRDQTLPQLATQLDALASGISNAVNAQNQAGFTAAGVAGGNLFSVPPPTGAARLMTLATADPNAIAASSSATAAGDNSNLLTMAGLQQQAIIGGQTPDLAYAGLISSVGSALNGINTQQQASGLVLTQLQNQRDSVSGVSMDEESINLNQFQAAYQAAARVVSVINTLTNEAINLGKL
ncbi:MAG: flagellar hook-associated protein FlgK [Terriglobales bacterium]